MKKLFILFMTLTLSFTIAAKENILEENRDIEEFDHPLLLGDWTMIESQNVEGYSFDVSFNDNYVYTINMVENFVKFKETGYYKIEDDKILLESNDFENKKTVLSMYFNHEKMMLNNIYFQKEAPNKILGGWSSTEVGSVSGKPPIEHFEIDFYDNFLFETRSSKKNGGKIKGGVYTVMNNQMVLFYADGQTSLRFKMDEEQLLLDIEDGDLLTRMTSFKTF